RSALEHWRCWLLDDKKGTSLKRSSLIVWLAAVLAAYLGAYMAFRSAHRELWIFDGETYVIFPNGAAYYFFRPLSLLDAKFTDTRFHIGPHAFGPPVEWLECDSDKDCAVIELPCGGWAPVNAQHAERLKRVGPPACISAIKSG